MLIHSKRFYETLVIGDNFEVDYPLSTGKEEPKLYVGIVADRSPHITLTLPQVYELQNHLKNIIENYRQNSAD